MRNYNQEILALALPVLATLLVEPLVSLLATAFVGRLGTAELGALGVNSSIFALTFATFTFFIYGTTPIIGRAVGQRNADYIRRFTLQVLLLAGIFGALTVALLQLGAHPILQLMGARGELSEPSLSYLRIRALSAPAILLVAAGNGIFRGYQDTRTPFLVILVMSVVEVTLTPLFIFAYHWGLAGAAWAAVITNWLGALGFVALLWEKARLKLTFANLQLATLGPLLRVGGMLAVRTLALIGTTTFATAIAARVGVEAVAAHQVAIQLWLFLALILDAFAVTAQALVSRYRGENQAGAAHIIARRTILVSVTLAGLLSMVFIGLEGTLPRLFSQDPEVIRNVQRVFPFVVLSQPLTALAFMLDGILIGYEDFDYLARAMLFSAAVSVFVLLLVLPLGLGLSGVWWGFMTLLIMRVVTLGKRYLQLGV